MANKNDKGTGAVTVEPQTVNRLAGASDGSAVNAGRAATEPSPVGVDVRSIAVVGMAPAAVQEIPRLPEGTEVWTLNVGPQAFIGEKNWHRHYEVHDYDWLKERKGNNVEPYLKWLISPHDNPIYMPRVDERIPASVQYPLTEIIERYGRVMPDGRPGIYFQSTVDWMLVHAIHELSEDAQREKRAVSGKIHLLGVDMGLDLEYMHQRPSCEHWLGVALGMGIEITVPQTSDILQCAFPYGLATYEPRAKKMQQRRNELEKGAQEAAQAEQQARDRKMALRGALDDIKYMTQGMY